MIVTTTTVLSGAATAEALTPAIVKNDDDGPHTGFLRQWYDDDSKRRYLLVAKDAEGAVLGAAFARKLGAHQWDPASMAAPETYVNYLYVLKNQRRKGVATALLNELPGGCAAAAAPGSESPPFFDSIGVTYARWGVNKSVTAEILSPGTRDNHMLVYWRK